MPETVVAKWTYDYDKAQRVVEQTLTGQNMAPPEDQAMLEGSAARLGSALAEFVSDGPVDDRRRRWELMENHVFAQDDIFSAAEPTISVHVRISVLDLLFHLVQGASYRDDDPGRRCLERAAAGGWLFVREAIAGPPAVTEACLEVLDISSPECASFARLVTSR